MGLIEIDLPVNPNCTDEPGLWQDLARVGADPRQADSEHSSTRWRRPAEVELSGLAMAPVVFADLPRLSRELDAEICSLINRIRAARDE